jgi:hypothetical protein
MELKIIYLLSGAILASILTTLSAPHKIFVPVSQITISSIQVPHQDNSLPSLPGKLALSQAQQEQIIKIKWEANVRAYQILNIEQQKELKNALERGLHLSLALNVISISTEQKNKLLNVFHFAQEQIKKILTPEQLDYIQQLQKTNSIIHSPTTLAYIKKPKNIMSYFKCSFKQLNHYL